MTSQEKASLLLFLFFLVGLYGLEAFVLVYSAFGQRRGPARKVLLAKPAIVLHVVVSVGVLCMLYGYFIEPYWLDVHTETIHTAKLTGPGIRIVQISDLHCDRKARNEEKIVGIIERKFLVDLSI